MHGVSLIRHCQIFWWIPRTASHHTVFNSAFLDLGLKLVKFCLTNSGEPGAIAWECQIKALDILNRSIVNREGWTHRESPLKFREDEQRTRGVQDGSIFCPKALSPQFAALYQFKGKLETEQKLYWYILYVLCRLLTSL